MVNQFDYLVTSKFRICLQREGHILKIAKETLSEALKIRIPSYNSSSRVLLNIVKNGEIAIIYLKDKMVCNAIRSGFVDLGIVGSDRIYENNFDKSIEKIKIIEKISWPFVIAIPVGSSIKNISGIRTIATEFPKSLHLYLDSVGLGKKIKIIKIQGSSEVLPYGDWCGKRIDAIADISITGKSLINNSLAQLGKPINFFHPVIIANKKSYKLSSKIIYINQFM